MTGNESAGLEDSKSHTTCLLSSLAADTGTPAGKESRARGGSWVTGDSPSRWAQSPPLLAGTLLEMASAEAKDSPLVHFTSLKDSDLWLWHF